MEAVNRLSPGRTAPSDCGPALPVLKYSMPSVGSIATDCHIVAPPCVQACARPGSGSLGEGHVSLPSSPGDGIEGEDVVVARGDVHDAVDDNRIGFEDVLTTSARAEPGKPGAFEAADIARIELIERRVTLVVERATVGDPVSPRVPGLR